MQYIYAVATLIVAFFMCFFSYRQGIKDGMQIHRGEGLKPLHQKPHKPSKLQEKEIERVQQGILNRLNYVNRKQVH